MSFPALRRALSALAVAGPLATAATMLGQAACGSSCPAVERTYQGAAPKVVGSFSRWETSSVDGPFLPFEGGVVLHLQHHLGARPQTPLCYLSFDPYPLVSGAGGAVFPTGNEVAIKSVGCDEVIVQNQTCSSFYIRCVLDVPLGASCESSTADGGDAATEGG